MKRGVLFLFTLLAGAIPLSSARAASDAAELVSPEHKIILGQNDGPWQPLFTQLGAKHSIFAKFTENRYLPFKKIPVVFTGEVRLSPEHGLSLHYTAPENRLMIVDEQGVVLRDAHGHSRELPADPRAQETKGALLQVMRFDLPALAQSFDLYGIREGTTWRFAFEPRDRELARTLSRLVVSGENAEVKKIEMRKSALQSVEILIQDARDGVVFSPEEIARFFR